MKVLHVSEFYGVGNNLGFSGQIYRLNGIFQWIKKTNKPQPNLGETSTRPPIWTTPRQQIINQRELLSDKVGF